MLLQILSYIPSCMNYGGGWICIFYFKALVMKWHITGLLGKITQILCHFFTARCGTGVSSSLGLKGVVQFGAARSISQSQMRN